MKLIRIIVVSNSDPSSTTVYLISMRDELGSMHSYSMKVSDLGLTSAANA
jgi:hypothetical protein